MASERAIIAFLFDNASLASAGSGRFAGRTKEPFLEICAELAGERANRFELDGEKVSVLRLAGSTCRGDSFACSLSRWRSKASSLLHILQNDPNMLSYHGLSLLLGVNSSSADSGCISIRQRYQ